MSGTVTAACPSCRGPLERPFPVPESMAGPCRHCGTNPPPLAETVLEGGLLTACPACETRHLYRQKDFSRKLGLLVVIVAAILAPFTWYLSLVAAALLDLALYFVAGDVIICYRHDCQAQIRGLPPGPEVRGFDLATYDAFRSRTS